MMILKSILLRTISLLLLFDVCSWSQAEYFTAIVEVEYLLDTHKRVMDNLDDYIQKAEKRLVVLKKIFSIYKREHKKVTEEIPNYLENPINAFKFIKMLTTDLEIIEKTLKFETEYIMNGDLKYPTLEDLTGAAQALVRLQVTYKLKVSDMAAGILNGVSYNTSMTAGDCFEVGRVLYNVKDYQNALAWMLEALAKYKEETQTFHEDDTLEYSDIKQAIERTKTLLVLDLREQKRFAEVEEASRGRRRRGETEEVNPDPYKALCRDEMEIASVISRQLKCFYLTETHPFLRLAPIKTEQMYIKPDIYIFHEVMSDREISAVKEMALPNFQRAVVHDPNTNSLVPAQYRISKSAWLKDTDSYVVETISTRIQDMTGLSLQTAEELQVINYGIGGYYEPHFDFARKKEKAFDIFYGNRIATVLFYMSDVVQGGATVFTELGLTLFPIKGAAAFWMNLHPSGEGDLATRHAACPVLSGSKWVSNKWIHRDGQELIKPCTLDYQSEGFARIIPRPVAKTFS